MTRSRIAVHRIFAFKIFIDYFYQVLPIYTPTNMKDPVSSYPCQYSELSSSFKVSNLIGENDI